MNIRDLGRWISTLLVVGLVGAIVLGQVLGQPILLGFVVTGSMSPTLEPGDGFIAIPPSLTGEIEEGDVVTFHAQELQGGGLTTHRIVGETSGGYITQGDANPFTDQDGPEPPVSESQIVAVAWQMNGEVVVIPGLGEIVMLLQDGLSSIQTLLAGIPGLGSFSDGGVGVLLIGFGVVVLALSVLVDLVFGGSTKRREGARSTRRKGVVRPSVVLGVLILLVVIPVTASMVVPSGVSEFEVISSQSPTSDPLVIRAGTSNDIPYNGTNSGFIPRIIILEPASQGVQVSQSVMAMAPGESASSIVTISVPADTGVYSRALSAHHYLLILPKSVILYFHSIHPWLPIIVIDLLVSLIVTVLFVLILGFQPVTLRSRNRDISMIDKLKRLFR